MSVLPHTDDTVPGAEGSRSRSIGTRSAWLSLAAGATLAGFGACQPDLDTLVAGNRVGLTEGGSGSGGTSSQGGTQSSSSSSNSDTTGSSAGGTSSLGGEGGEPGATSTEGGAGAPPDHCSDNERNSGETDEDCGGENTCDRCQLGDRCISDGDCHSSYCAGAVCTEPSCDDDIQNQNETAVDCGGACAPQNGCDLGLACKVDRDCISNACASGECVDHCESGKRDGDETDEDCGGSVCDPCAEGGHCQEGEDCSSGVCEDSTCIAATCDDDVSNQDETDVDCGGSCAPNQTCDVNQICNIAADCTSYVCYAGRCIPDIEIASEDVIDDMEDGDRKILALEERSGDWYSFHDGTGTDLFQVALIPGQRGPGSEFSMHYSGGAFTSWGGGIGFDLNNSGGSVATKAPYDASAFTGITFWARSEEPLLLTIAFPDGNTDAAGGLCTSCDHHWYARATLRADWARFTILFEDLILEGGTVPEPEASDPAALVSVQFRAPSGVEFDYWVDDVAFVR